MRAPSTLGFVAIVLASVFAPLACGSEATQPSPRSVVGDDSGDGGSAGDGTVFVPQTDTGPSLTLDSDDDGVPDAIEGTGDDDHDGKPNHLDPINDGEPGALTLVPISTNFNNPIGIDYHEPSNSVVLSVNYSTGAPVGFERIEFDGSHHAFSTLSGLTDEVKIATARSGNPGGFKVGDLFVGNGVDGQVVRITDDGATVINPWADFPGDNNGLMRGSLYVDRTGVFGGDLVVVTTTGEVWRVNASGVPTKVAVVPGVHLEGLIVVPNKPARFGPLAGKLIAGAEAQKLIYAFATDGTFTTYALDVAVEDIDLNTGKENFFGVDYGNARLLGAAPEQWATMVGDIILAEETPPSGTAGLVRLKWDGTAVVAQRIPVSPTSTLPAQWEHVTFAAAGIAEVAPVR